MFADKYELTVGNVAEHHARGFPSRERLTKCAVLPTCIEWVVVLIGG